MIFQDDDAAGVAFADGGLWEVADFMERPVTDCNMRNRSATRDVHGGLNFREALRVAQEGWHEGVALINDRLTGVPLMTNTQGVSHWRNDVAGELPDVPRYLSGEPAHMRRRTRREGNRPVVHIVVNTALVGNSRAHHQTNYGTALCGLIDWLESRGKRVELDRLGVVADGRRRSFQGWKIKRASDPLDMPATVFALAHMASHRHLVWGMRLRMRAIPWRPVSVTREDAARIGADNALIIDSVLDSHRLCETVQGATLLAAKRLNDAAGEELVDLQELADQLMMELRDVA